MVGELKIKEPLPVRACNGSFQAAYNLQAKLMVHALSIDKVQETIMSKFRLYTLASSTSSSLLKFL